MGALAAAPALRAARPAAPITQLRAYGTTRRLQRCSAEAAGSPPPAAANSCGGSAGSGSPATVAIEYRGRTVQAGSV